MTGEAFSRLITVRFVISIFMRCTACMKQFLSGLPAFSDTEVGD